MKIAVSSTGTDMDTQLDERFGRCEYFVIVDSATMEFETIENTGSMAGGGAGTTAGQMLAGKGVEVVLTGNCGPKAFGLLEAAGIKVVTGVSGSVRDAVRKFADGELTANGGPSVSDHHGR